MRKVLLFFLSLCCIMLPASAITMDGYEQLRGICIYDDSSYELLICDNDTILHEDIFGASYSRDHIYNMASEPIDVAYDGDYIYYVCLNGEVYRTRTSSGLIDFNADLGEGTISLGNVGSISSSTYQKILVDDNGAVYVNNGVYVYKFSYPTYSMIAYCTLPYSPAGICFTDWDTLISARIGGTPSLYEVTGLSSYSTIRTLPNIYTNAFVVLDNSNLIYSTTGGASGGVNGVFELSNYSTAYATQTTIITGLNNFESAQGDLVCFTDGTLLLAHSGDDEIKMYTTTSGAGGISYSLPDSSSSDDTVDNPLFNMDDPEDAKDIATNYSGITWIFLIMLFLLAAMGARQ